MPSTPTPRRGLTRFLYRFIGFLGGLAVLAGLTILGLRLIGAISVTLTWIGIVALVSGLAITLVSIVLAISWAAPPTPSVNSERSIDLDDIPVPSTRGVGADNEPDRSDAHSISKDESPVFSAFHPRHLTVGKRYTLAVYIHTQSAKQAVQRDVERFRDEMGDVPFRVSTPSMHPLYRGIELTIVPECDGVTFTPDHISLTWSADWRRATFDMVASQLSPSSAISAVNGEIAIFAGPLLVATLDIAVLLQTTDNHAHTGETADVSGAMYQRIFASYSHDDTNIVEAFNLAYLALGYDNLIDIHTLRSGENWSGRLNTIIYDAQIFQLFWSPRSATSPYVRKEWEYALGLSRPGFIRPVYWQKPVAPIPEPLRSIHFKYVPFIEDGEAIHRASSTHSVHERSSPDIPGAARHKTQHNPVQRKRGLGRFFLHKRGSKS